MTSAPLAFVQCPSCAHWLCTIGEYVSNLPKNYFGVVFYLFRVKCSRPLPFYAIPPHLLSVLVAFFSSVLAWCCDLKSTISACSFFLFGLFAAYFCICSFLRLLKFFLYLLFLHVTHCFLTFEFYYA